jgi:uncharacterized protein (TIGR03086 family)
VDLIDCLDAAFAATGRLIAKASPDDFGAPTPCSDWDVRMLLNHTIGVVARFGIVASRSGEAVDLTTDWVGTDPSSRFEALAGPTLAAWSTPGALDGPLILPNGRASTALDGGRRNFVDTLVHGWDLATAVGLDATIEPALATAALEASELIMSDGLRGPGRPFAAPVQVGPGASPTDRLVAFLGRRP